MATFAVMSGNLVNNVIVADTKEIAEQVIGSVCIEYMDENPAGIGWTWNGNNFTNPMAVVEEIPEEIPTE